MSEVRVDNYKITGIIGRGGMGAIYYGEDPMLKRPVAIKMVRPELVSEQLVVERFRSEAVTTAKLNHPNIATVYELVEQNGMMFLVMEFVSGWTLAQVLRICGGLTPQQTIAIIKPALTGIGYAHKQGVIHRDLKPTNLMLNENGIVKVMDFGIARVLSGPKYTRTGQLVGTLKYMPPEQIRGEELDARTDVYALGIVMYKLLTGRVPFSAESDYQLMKAAVEKPPPPPKTFQSNISDPLQAAILKALSKSAEDRYPSARDFIAALEACPENPRAGQGKLEELAELMQNKHPIPILPLNQQAVDMIKSSSLSAKNQVKHANIVKSMFGTFQQNVTGFMRNYRLPPNNHWRTLIVATVLVLVVGVLGFIYFVNTPSVETIRVPVSEKGEEMNGQAADDPQNDEELKWNWEVQIKEKKENQ